MSGLLSTAPAPSSIRLIVGGHLLLLVQTALVLASGAALDSGLRAIIVLTATLAAASFIAAIRGERSGRPTDWWRRGHER